MPKKITVTGRITAGIHPRLGAIIQGQEYTINAADYSSVLFEPLPIEPVGAIHESPAPDLVPTPAKSGKKGR